MKILFVCQGNICRSPMAEVICRFHLDAEGLSDQVSVCSAGTSGWHVGEPADRRTVAELEGNGYVIDHVARRIDDRISTVDFVIVFDHHQVDYLASFEYPVRRLLMLGSFDPEIGSDDIDDPFHQEQEAFRAIRIRLERAMPSLIDYVRAELARTT
ncbi:low molecular weight protein-tyrosine-phosphatase [Nocardia amamiensis]|uniref:low molecular weight protein-tyrosine-phosphatase n=1 Tax=Nocardia amamiensis TaxID=404578 RepID=UPI003411DB10